MKQICGVIIAAGILCSVALAGSGTVNDPYTIAQALALSTNKTEYYAQGYIVGGAYNNFDPPWTNDYSVSCADTDSESDVNNCLQVKLEKDGGRDAWGLASNPGNVGKLIKFKGFRDAYGTYPSFEGVDNADISEVALMDQPPIIDPIGNKSVVWSNTLSFVVTATDTVDNDQIVLSATGLPAGAVFAGATNTGSASSTFTWANAGPLGVYTTTFWAVDNDGTNSAVVQITVSDGSEPVEIAFQGFEGTANDTWGIASANYVLNTAGASDTPANQRIRTGSYSWQPGNTEELSETLELDEVDVSAYSDVMVELHLSATTEYPEEGYGMFPSETLGVFLALDGGEYPAEADMTVMGNELKGGSITGALWSYTATGIAVTTAGVSSTVAPTAGGVTPTGIATVRIAVPAGTTAVKLQAVSSLEYYGYYYNVDDISLTGIADGGAADFPPSIAVNPAGTDKSVAVGKTMSFTITGTEIPNDAADEVRLWATGLPAGAGFAGATNVGSATGTFQWTPTEAGSSVVSFYAGDKDGTNRIDVTVTAYDVGAGGAAYGVFVGLNKYSSSYIDSSSFLSGCVPDANHIYTNTIQRGDWTPATVTRLLDSAGTKAAIRRAITNCAATAVAGDKFMYFHSSHGGQNSGTSVYICSYDDDYQDTELAADLAKFAAGVKVVVVVDTCHSGGLFKSAPLGTRAAAPPGGVWDLAGNVSRIMDEDRAAKLAAGRKDVLARISSSEIGWITAADYDQYSWDGDDGGVFTSKLIEGWTNPVPISCDLNGDAYANFYELYDYSWDVAIADDTTAMAYNTNVLLNTIAGWIGSEPPGGLIVFSNMTPQSVTVGQTLTFPVGAATAGTNSSVTVTMTTVQPGASYSGGVLTFAPSADGTYLFNFTATNTLGATANAGLTVNATLAAPVLAAPTGIGPDRFTINWASVAGAASYLLDVATADTFSPGGSGETETIVEVANSAVESTPGWEYVGGASYSGTSVGYHKLIGSDPGVVSEAFSTVGYLEAAASFSVATYGGSSANVLTLSYSLDGGTTWVAFGTNDSATASSPYVSGSASLPAAALGQGSVRVKWHCAVATESVGLRLQALKVTGVQPAGGNTLVLAAQDAAGPSYTVTGLDWNTTYYYRIWALGNAAGPYSATGTVSTSMTSNSPPVLSAIPPQETVAGTAIEPVQLVWAEPDGDLVSLDCDTTVAADLWNLTEAGLFTFTPNAVGTFTFTFTASDDAEGPGEPVTFTVTAGLATPVLVPDPTVSSVSFVAAWSAVPGALSYVVDVVQGASSGGGVVLTEDFAGFAVSNTTDVAGSLDEYTAAAGWIGSKIYQNIGSIKLGTSSAQGWIATPALDLSGTTKVSFKAASWPADATTVLVGISTDGGATYTDDSVVLSETMTAYEVTFPAGAAGSKIRWMASAASKERFFLDDVSIETGAARSLSGTPLPGYPVNVGNVTSHEVTGLDPMTEYTYSVQAVSGEVVSDWAEPYTVNTTDEEAAPSFAVIPPQAATLLAPFSLDVAGYVSGSPTPALQLLSSTANAADYGFAGGTLSFTPSATGTFAFVFQATNVLGTASATATVAVASGPVTLPVASIANLSSNSFTVNWTACTGASNYQVQVATDADFTSGGGGNLMANPGFETGDGTDWDKFESGYSVVTTSPQEGTYAVQCQATETRDLMQTVSITGDGTTTYEISYYYRTTAGDGTDVRIWASWSAGGQVSGDSLQPSTYNATTAEWTKMTYQVVPAAGVNTLNFEVRVYNGATVFLDNFFVGPVGGGGGMGSIILDETQAALTCHVTGLEPETPYYVRVRMEDGTWSEIVSVTTTDGGTVVTPDPEPLGDFVVVPGGAEVSMSIPSVTGINYGLQYTTQLLPPNWIDVMSLGGTGAGITLEDLNPTDDQRFYRVIRK